MASFFLGFYQHVIDVDFDVSAYLVKEHSIHEPLIGDPRVLQSEWHHFVTEEPSAHDERCLFLVSLVHHSLVML